MLGHTKYGVQRVYCSSAAPPLKPFYGSHSLNLVMNRLPGIKSTWPFVISPDYVWYARVLLLFLATATQILGKIVVPLQQWWKAMTILKMVIIIFIFVIITNLLVLYSLFSSILYLDGWNRLDLALHMSLTTGSRCSTSLETEVFTLPLCFPIQNIIGKLPVVLVGDVGTIPNRLSAPGD